MSCKERPVRHDMPCLICGKPVTGRIAKYCSEACRKKAAAPAKEKPREKRSYHKWKGYKEGERRCKGCIHFRTSYSHYRICHLYLDRGIRRPKDPKACQYKVLGQGKDQEDFSIKEYSGEDME